MVLLWTLAGLTVVVATIDGIRHGVVRRAVELVGLIAVFVFAARLADLLTPRVQDSFDIDGTVAFYASWVIVLVGGVILVRLAASGLRKVVHLTLAGWLDRAGGGLLGFAFGVVLSSCLFIVVHALPISDELRVELEEDPAASALLHFAPSVYDAGREYFGGERFFEMIRDHVEPATSGLRDRLGGEGDSRADVHA